MIVCFFLVFGSSFYLFFFLFWVLSWLLCSITSAHIILHEYWQQSSCVSVWVHNKQLVSLCYKWLQPSDTLGGLSNHYIVIKTFAEHQCWALTSQASWFPFALRSPQCALAAGRMYYLLLRLLLVVVIAHWFGFCSRILCGFNAVLLCNARFLDGLASATSGFYGPWPVVTIRRPTVWLRQWILASMLAYTFYASCATYWTVILFVTSLYTW